MNDTSAAVEPRIPAYFLGRKTTVYLDLLGRPRQLRRIHRPATSPVCEF